MNDKKKKQLDSNSALLSQGLPFEFLVAKELSNLGFSPKGEYEYYKHNKAKERELFSIDNQALYVDEESKIRIELLLEVKYSNETPWVFFADPNDREYRPQSLNGLIPASLLEFDVIKGIKTKSGIPGGELEYAAYGIEASRKKEDYNRINHACRQLQWAFVDRYISYHSLRAISPLDLDIEFGYQRFFAVVVITNADLLFLNENVTLDQMQGSSLENITTKKDIVPLYRKIDSNLMNEALYEAQRMNTTGTLLSADTRAYFHHKNVHRAFRGTITEAPTIYWITNVSSMHALCQKLKEIAKLWINHKQASA